MRFLTLLVFVALAGCPGDGDGGGYAVPADDSPDASSAGSPDDPHGQMDAEPPVGVPLAGGSSGIPPTTSAR